MLPNLPPGPIDWAGLSLLLSAALIIYITLTAALTHLRLSRPQRKTYGWAVARNLPADPTEACDAPFEDHRFISQNTAIHYWDVPGNDPNGPITLITHGWGSSRIAALSRLNPCLQSSSRVILWDMPGHGDSAGTCTLANREPAHLLNLLNHLDLQHRAKTDPPLILFGWSLGAEVTLRAAAKLLQTTEKPPSDPALALILEGYFAKGMSPARSVMSLSNTPVFPNLHLALFAFGLAAGDPRHRWRDTTAIAEQINAPSLVIHGTEDRVCAPKDGERLARALSATLCMVNGAGHNNIWTDPDTSPTAEDALNNFYRALKQRRSESEAT